MHEGKEMINDTYEVKDDYADIIEAIHMANSGILSYPDQEEIKATLSKILLSYKEESNAHYSLLTVIQLLELKSAMKIEIETSSCEFKATNIKFNHLQFNDETLVIYFDKCSFEIENIGNILSIKTMDEIPLKEHLSKSLDILKPYPKEEVAFLNEFLLKF